MVSKVGQRLFVSHASDSEPLSLRLGSTVGGKEQVSPEENSQELSALGVPSSC